MTTTQVPSEIAALMLLLIIGAAGYGIDLAFFNLRFSKSTWHVLTQLSATSLFQTLWQFLLGVDKEIETISTRHTGVVNFIGCSMITGYLVIVVTWIGLAVGWAIDISIAALGIPSQVFYAAGILISLAVAGRLLWIRLHQHLDDERGQLVEIVGFLFLVFTVMCVLKLSNLDLVGLLILDLVATLAIGSFVASKVSSQQPQTQ